MYQTSERFIQIGKTSVFIMLSVYRSVVEEFNVNHFMILFGYEFIRLISPFIWL